MGRTKLWWRNQPTMTEFKGGRGTKSKPIAGPHLVYGFLTTSPNAVVKPNRPDRRASKIPLQLLLHRRWLFALRAFSRCAATHSVDRIGPALRLELALVVWQHRATRAPLRIFWLFAFFFGQGVDHSGKNTKA
jgi:hypothetical protein